MWPPFRNPQTEIASSTGGSGEVEVESLTDAAKQVVEEARMVLPGIQALFGFQLIAVFNQRYADLAEAGQRLHLLALILTGVSVALIMTPAAYHRQAEPRQISRYFLILASRSLTLAMLVLAVGIGLDIYVVSSVILLSQSLSALIGLSLFGTYIGAWFVFPHWKRRRRRDGIAS
jgi:hypothetical protein